jgi:rhodanese-related sulfurtransferase
MKKIFIVLPVLILLILADAGCTGKKPENKPAAPAVSVAPVKVGNESLLLLKDLEQNGDYVKSKTYPSLIKASIVQESLNSKMLVLDIRSAEQYSKGHIKGALNMKFEELPGYFESGIKPFEYDKIILVCDDGQVSGYTSCLLRLMGYGNVYAMRWGMSSWKGSFAAEGWMKGVSGKFESAMETRVNERPVANGMPDLKTGMSTGESIGKARFSKLFEEGTGNILISADEVFSNPQKYFIINLERKDKYEDGHIPGAMRYKPEGTLGLAEEMATIPADKTVVVYCGTGHNSSFATAYLRLFGYDARTLKYGNNGFMHDKMIAQKTALSWLPFSTADVNDFEVEKSN